jgi:hypothetical protein
MEMWFNRMREEEKDWLYVFLLEKLDQNKQKYVSILEDEIYSDIAVSEIENYKSFCVTEINMCNVLIDRRNSDFNDFLQKRVPPPF